MSDRAIGPAVQHLLGRLDAIGARLEKQDGALALLGLGSVGLDVWRADRFSDLDFFVIAEADTAVCLREDLSWLASVETLSFAHRNTADGWKVLFADGIFGEFAVFSPEQLANIPFQPGRIIWSREGVDVKTLKPTRQAVPTDFTWTVSEALTCIYVGLCRFRRGEVLASHRMIQGHALDLVLTLIWASHEGEQRGDPFNPSRRAELIWPDRRAWLRQACAGYGQSIEAAQILLTELHRFGPLPKPLLAAIEALLAAPYLKDDHAAL